MPLQPWPKSTSRSIPTNVQRIFQGVNYLDPFTISDNESADISNMTTANYPDLSTRPGYSLLGTARAAKILGLGVWKQSEMQTISNGTWYKYSAGAWSAVSGGGSLSTSANWSFTNFEGNFGAIYLLAANGTDAVKKYDGSTVSSLTDAPTGGNYIEQYGERVWCVVGNDIHCCASGNATNWSTFNGDDADPYIKTLDTPDGETINGIRAGVGRLVIFKPNSIHQMFGGLPSNFNFKPVTFDVGAVSNQAITSVEGILYFIHKSGFYQFSGGTLPTKDWSKPIQSLINRINPAQISKCVVGSNGKYVYAAIPLDSATDPDTIIEYNAEFGVFSVWKNYAPLNMATMSSTLYIGGVEGEIRQVGGSTSDNGTPISYKVISKPYGAESLGQRIMIKRAWLTAKVSTGATMNVGLSKSPDGDTDFTTVQAISADNAINSSRVIIPTTTVSFANWWRYKISGTGVVNIKEFAWESEQLPIV